MKKIVFILLLIIILLNAKNSFDYYKEGELLHQKGEYQLSIGSLDKALRLLDRKDLIGHAMVNYALGVNYARINKLKKARDYFLEALKYQNQVNPYHKDTINLCYTISDIYKKLHDFENDIKYYKLALNKKIKVYGKDSKKVANAYSHLGGKYFELGVYNQALKYFQKAVDIGKKIHLDISNDYHNIAGAYTNMGDFNKALEFHNKALKLRLKLHPKNHIKIAYSYVYIAMTYDDKGEYNKSIKYYKKALDIYLKSNNSDKDIADIFNNLAIVYNKLKEYQKAIKYQLKAINIKRKLGIDIATEYINIASYYSDVGEYQKAFNYAQRALIICKEKLGENHISIAEIYDTIGLIYKDKGEYKKALEFQLKSIKITENISKNSLKVANYYNGLSDIYMYLGDYKKARTYIEKSIKIREDKLGKTHPDTITSYHNLASLYGYLGNSKKALEYETKAKNGVNHFNAMVHIYGNQGKLKEALKYALKSLKIRKNKFGEFHLQTAQAYHNIGTIYNDMYQPKKALPYIKKAIEIREKILGEKSSITAKSYNSLSQIYLSMENYSKSLKYAQKSIISLKSNLGETHPTTAMSYMTLSVIQLKLSKFEKAYKAIKKAYNINTKNRNYNFSILDNQEKLKYIKSNNMVISALLSVTFFSKNQEYIKESFNSWLNYKRVIFNNQNSLKLLYSKNKSKIDELYQTQRKLARLYQNIPQKNLKEYNQQIEEIQKRISKLERALTTNSKDIVYQDIANLLKPNELYIDFAKIKNDYYYFTLDKSQNITFQKLEKPKEIEDYIVRIREDLGDIPTNITKKRYAKLYNLIFKNIDIKDKTSLIISPDGLLGLIPFEAFYIEKEQKYLIEKLKIRYIPSGKELVKLYQNRTTPKEDIVVFANPNFGLKTASSKERKGTIEALYSQAKNFNRVNNFFGSLAGSIYEADTINSLFRDNTEIYMKDKANEENFFKLNSPKILHLSTHGFFIKDKNILNPMLKTGIALSGANYAIANKTGDGIITGLELSGLNLNGTELVVLSACETGVGDVEEAEGVAGLSKAFMRAGAKYIVMSLWSVDDKATVTLMEKFYENIKEGKSYSVALREAKLFMIINSKSNPFYWAGFVGSGED